MARIVKIDTDINHTRLIELVAMEADVHPDAARAVLRATFDIIGRAVLHGHRVTVTNFGSWTARLAPGRVARNPQTGELHQVPARRVPKFTFSEAIVHALVRDVRPTTLAKKARGTGRRVEPRGAFDKIAG